MAVMETRDLWENVLTHVELSISPANFNTWFKDSNIVKVEDGIVYVGVPSQFFKDWYLKKFHTLLLKIFRSISYEIRNIDYMIVRDEKRRRQTGKKPATVNLKTDSLPLEQYYINKNDNLNPRYTFDLFVVGRFNELAYTASKAVLENPGITYNPLFIYGPTGTGKTHLLQAVGNQFKKLYPNRKVYYLTSERFANEFIASVQAGTASRFKEKYRQYDLIIIDDVQFFSKTEKSQEELFHLFNALHDNNKQIIFSSDKNPNYIPNITDRLKTRFSSGMMIDISEPDLEARQMILRKKTAQHGIILPDDIVETVAGSAVGSIRELEGILNSIVCQTQLRGEVPSLQEVKNIVKSITRPQKTISVKGVVEKIAEFYNIEENSIYEKTRKREVVKPRQVIMYILREDYNISYPAIGEKLGGRDHTTVIHSCEKVKEEVVSDVQLAEEIDQIRALLA
jgi:chromosomal replication initiator protein